MSDEARRTMAVSKPLVSAGGPDAEGRSLSEGRIFEARLRLREDPGCAKSSPDTAWGGALTADFETRWHFNSVDLRNWSMELTNEI